MLSSFRLFLLLALLVPVFTVQAQRAPDLQFGFAEFVEPDFPFITTTLDAGSLGMPFPNRNVAVRCLVLMLGNETYACFDPDLLRISAIWHGEFMSMLTMAQVSYQKAGNKGNGIPEILGTPLAATGVYPGWLTEGAGYDDPRPAINPDEMGRGPIDESLGHWGGIYLADDRFVLNYRIGTTEVGEAVHGVSGRPGVVRSFELGPQEEMLTLVLAEYIDPQRIRVMRNEGRVQLGDQTIHFKLEGDLEGVELAIDENRYVVARIKPAENRNFAVGIWKTTADKERGQPVEISIEVPPSDRGSSSRWPSPVSTLLTEGKDPVQGYVVDELALPLPNPWNRNVRISGLDFFSDGRAAVSTFEGDVWIISGLNEGNSLNWKRYASGLYEPMSLSIVQDEIYVFGREGILRLTDLNGDNEADFYENFSNAPIQTIESREYPSSMHPKPGGGFYLSKGAATNNGPKTSPSIMTGFRAGGPHSGTILSVSADGRTVERFATGFRQPYIGVHPEKGWVTASDQQGNFVPSSPVYFVQEGDYYGVPATAHQEIPPEIAQPLTWVPHNVDRSGTEQVWITSEQFGPLSGALIHLSYGQPGIFLVYHEVDDDKLVNGAFAEIPISFSGPLMEGAIHPIDGQLYTGGFQVWDSSAEDVSNLFRVRYVGGPFTLPTGFKKGQEGVILEFDQALNKEDAEQIANYEARRWNYKRTPMYGSGVFRRNGIPGKERVQIVNAALSSDGKKVFVQLHNLQNVMQMEFQYRLRTNSGELLEKSLYFSWHEENRFDLSDEGFSGDAIVAIDDNLDIDTEDSSQKVASLERGQEIYQQIGCIGCHSIDGSTEGRTGSTFLGLWGSLREFNDGTSLVADKEYIRESIFDPGAKEVKGRSVEMPSYVGLLDESDIDSIILFIRSLDEEE
ncbi:MAG: cytochrome c [Rhodothermaceae bacterium]|nr:cytochrome c [Rhodothermaceae bacterium]